MGNAYTQLYVQLVFAVQGRQSLIKAPVKEEVYRYITGILQGDGHKMLAINGMPDHIHIFFGLNPKQAISDIVRNVKSSSSGFIHEQKLIHPSFAWQEGYGAFSYTKSHKDRVIKYILNQEAHHAKKSFREEYLGILDSLGIEYKEQYLFDWITY